MKHNLMLVLMILLVLAAGTARAQNKPCVIVSAVRKPVTIYNSVERFPYIDSMNLPVSQIKSEYKKKDIEKLEKQGVKIVVTNGAAARRNVSVDVGVNQTISDDLQAAHQACQQ